MEESSRLEGLSKEIGIVIRGGDKRDNKTAFLNKFANKVVPSINVLCAGMILWVIRRINGSFIVQREPHWLLVWLEPEFIVQPV